MNFLSQIQMNKYFDSIDKNGPKRIRNAPADTTVTPGARQGLQYKNWTITMFPERYESKDDCYDVLTQLGDLCTYACFGLEHAPNTKKVHLQGFLMLEKKMRLTELKKIDPFSHFERMKGTVQQNYDYCTKEDKTPMEFGTRPQFENNGERERNRWSTARQSAIERHWADVDDQIYVSHYGNLRRIAAEHPFTTSNLDKCCGVWLYGVPHSGKSYDARNKYCIGTSPYLKESTDHWWDNYEGQETVIIEDVDPDTCIGQVAQRLKVWCDVYPFACQYKGGTNASIRPRRVIVTSNYSIEECFPKLHGDALQALKRRFSIVHYPHTIGVHVNNSISAPDVPEFIRSNTLPLPTVKEEEEVATYLCSIDPKTGEVTKVPELDTRKKRKVVFSESEDEEDEEEYEDYSESEVMEVCGCGDSDCEGCSDEEIECLD